MWIKLLGLSMGVMATVGLAQVADLPGDSDCSTDLDCGHYDLHGNNRAVAFGSIILAGEGSDVAEWKELNAYDICPPWMPGPIPIPNPDDPTGPFPEDPPSGSDDGDDDDSNSSECEYSWDVMVTTNHELEVCPDGRAFIIRSGEGVMLKDRFTGETYGWSEMVWCDDDDIGLTESLRLNAKRPLDLSRIKRFAK